LQPNNIIVAPTPQGEQAFRIRYLEPTNKKVKLKALHVYYDTDNYLISDSYVVDKDCNDALDHLNSATDTASPFTTLSDVTTVNSFRCVRKSLNEAITVILERWGGHLVRDNFTIEIRETIGQDNGVTIQYAKNLKEIEASYDWSGVCTKLLPVGKDGFTLENLYLYSETQYDIPFTKTVSFEQDINREDYSDDEHYYTALRDDLTAQGMRYLEKSQLPAVNYTLNANVEKITDVGDTVEVVDERLGVTLTAAVLAFNYDCILEKYTAIEFGTLGATLSNLLNNVTSEIDNKVTISAQAVTNNLQEALAESEAKIFGVMGSSYVIYNGDYILVVDALPAETATNVIRINSAGIAFSNTGINGHFTTAWTIDGTFNAQAINVINLTASMIKGGTLKLGSFEGVTGLLEVYDDANNLVAELNNNGLKVYGLDGSYVIMNNSVGFAGYDRLGNKLFWVDETEFKMSKAVVENEITLCNKLRFIPVEIYDSNNNLVNDGIGLVSVYL
jgi:phage minor structural protein